MLTCKQPRRPWHHLDARGGPGNHADRDSLDDRLRSRHDGGDDNGEGPNRARGDETGTVDVRLEEAARWLKEDERTLDRTPRGVDGARVQAQRVTGNHDRSLWCHDDACNIRRGLLRWLLWLG